MHRVLAIGMSMTEDALRKKHYEGKHAWVKRGDASRAWPGGPKATTSTALADAANELGVRAR